MIATEDLIYECAKIIINKHLDTSTESDEEAVAIIKKAITETAPVVTTTYTKSKLIEDDIIGQYNELSDIQILKNITHKLPKKIKRKDYSKVSDDHLYELDSLLLDMNLTDSMGAMNSKYGWSKVLSTYSIMHNRTKSFIGRAPKYVNTLQAVV